MKFSVLMSVYYKEKPSNLIESLNSILMKQSLLPDEVILVKDGELTENLEIIIGNFKNKFSDRLNVISLKENVGLGRALNEGLKHCKYDFVARMDTDDIADYNRFAKQVRFLENNKSVDVVGGSIGEFYKSANEIENIRNVPSNMENIVKMMKRRNPMNHVTVMMRKNAVLNVGGYKHLACLEDYFLWIRLVEGGYILSNLDDVLVFVRTGEDMYRRRGNKEYINGWYYLQTYMKNMKKISKIDILINMISIYIFIYMPTSIKRVVYEKILRE